MTPLLLLMLLFVGFGVDGALRERAAGRRRAERRRTLTDVAAVRPQTGETEGPGG